MIRIKNHKQRHLFDPWGFLSPKRRRMLDEGWPGLFRELLLDELPVERMVPFFSKTFGRPTKDLCTVLGVLLFQQAMDFTDNETIDQLSFNILWASKWTPRCRFFGCQRTDPSFDRKTWTRFLKSACRCRQLP